LHYVNAEATLSVGGIVMWAQLTRAGLIALGVSVFTVARTRAQSGAINVGSQVTAFGNGASDRPGDENVDPRWDVGLEYYDWSPLTGTDRLGVEVRFGLYTTAVTDTSGYDADLVVLMHILAGFSGEVIRTGNIRWLAGVMVGPGWITDRDRSGGQEYFGENLGPQLTLIAEPGVHALIPVGGGTAIQLSLRATFVDKHPFEPSLRASAGLMLD
jgi:hypothetical protein